MTHRVLMALAIVITLGACAESRSRTGDGGALPADAAPDSSLDASVTGPDGSADSGPDAGAGPLSVAVMDACPRAMACGALTTPADYDYVSLCVETERLLGDAVEPCGPPERLQLSGEVSGVTRFGDELAETILRYRVTALYDFGDCDRCSALHLEFPDRVLLASGCLGSSRGTCECQVELASDPGREEAPYSVLEETIAIGDRSPRYCAGDGTLELEEDGVVFSLATSAD